MNNLQITDVTLSASNSNDSPTNNNANTTIKADDLNLQNLVERQSRNNNNGGASSPIPINRSRTTSNDGLTTISSTINRSRTESNTSLNNSNQGGSSNPGGSADTRRRITKLSKVREREKVPRLVEYFVVVSSIPVDNNSNENGGGDMQYSGMPPASPRRKNVTKVRQKCVNCVQWLQTTLLIMWHWFVCKSCEKWNQLYYDICFFLHSY